MNQVNGRSKEFPCAGETGRGRDTLVEETSVGVVVHCASGASEYRDVDGARCLLGNFELKAFGLTNIADCSSSFAVCPFTYSLSWIREDM